MCSKEKYLGKNYIGREENRSYGRQGFRTPEEDIQIEEISIRKLK